MGNFSWSYSIVTSEPFMQMDKTSGIYSIYNRDNLSRPMPDQWASRVAEAGDSRLYNFSMFSDILRAEAPEILRVRA